ncbi:hypothetical protein BDQ12DRAFT_573794, partial [Crucibulum laeve]
KIFTLHLATSFQGIKFYPTCTGFKVNGSSTDTPKQSELVVFMGGHSDSDKSI